MSQALRYLCGPFGRVGLVVMDTPLAVHVHRHCHVIAKIAGPDTLFQVKGRDWPVTDRAALVVGPWEPHGWRPVAADPCVFLTFYLECDWLRELGPSPDGHGPFDGYRTGTAELSAVLRNSLDRLAASMAAPGRRPSRTPSRRPGGTPGVELVADLAAELVAQADRTTSIHVSDRRVRRAMDLLVTDEARLSMATIAREAGLSRAHLFALFRDAMGVSPTVFANAWRMERAIEDLTRSDSSVTHIGTDLGFSAPANFTRFFRNQLGIAPTNFRASLARLSD